jgi:hypothetical protein
MDGFIVFYDERCNLHKSYLQYQWKTVVAHDADQFCQLAPQKDEHHEDLLAISLEQ